jgi:hypothetical protein
MPTPLRVFGCCASNMTGSIAPWGISAGEPGHARWRWGPLLLTGGADGAFGGGCRSPAGLILCSAGRKPMGQAGPAPTTPPGSVLPCEMLMGASRFMPSRSIYCHHLSVSMPTCGRFSVSCRSHSPAMSTGSACWVTILQCMAAAPSSAAYSLVDHNCRVALKHHEHG